MDGLALGDEVTWAQAGERHKLKLYPPPPPCYSELPFAAIRYNGGDFMAVVDEYSEGACRVIIYDDCMVETAEERQRIVEEMAAVWIGRRLKEQWERQKQQYRQSFNGEGE